MHFAVGRFVRWIVALVTAAMLLTNSTSAWDGGGHEVVATIAFDHLNPKAKKAVADLARELQNPEQVYDAISLACWMDDIKKNAAMPDYGKFLSWHYIDIGIAPGDPLPLFEPGDDNEIHGNVVQALKRSIVVLKGGTDPYVTSKAMASALAMHLVGDIHQPLHCATKYFFSYGKLRQDQGGNKEDVVNGPPDDLKFNLHAFWDSAWRASFDETSGRVMLDPLYQDQRVHNPARVRALAEEWEKQPPPNADLDTHIDQWARESNAVARDFAYRELTVTDNKKYCRLSSGYVAKAQQISRERLVLAGFRLARLLNDTLGADALPAPPPPYPAGPPGQPY
jgi:hypothetical protein